MKNNISLLRERKGINQSELARRLNINRSFVSRIENCKTKPSVGLAIKIAEILDCGLDDIFLQNLLPYTATNEGEERA